MFKRKIRAKRKGQECLVQVDCNKDRQTAEEDKCAWSNLIAIKTERSQKRTLVLGLLGLQ